MPPGLVAAVLCLLAALHITTAVHNHSDVRSAERSLHGASSGASRKVPRHVVHPWENNYAPWRAREPVDYSLWHSRVLHVKDTRLEGDQWQALPGEERAARFEECLGNQAHHFARRVLRYASPRLSDVTTVARNNLDELGARVVVAVFWGRQRYAYWRKTGTRPFPNLHP